MIVVASTEEKRRRNAEAARRYRQRHPEKVKEANDRWEARNPGKRQELVLQWRANNPEKVVLMARRRQVRRYGMTLEQYDEMLEAQNGVCAICQSPDPGGRGSWHVDHDHGSGAVRGLLCHSCNIALGLLKEDPAVIKRMADYLEVRP